MAWIHGIAERDHAICNPTTPAKIRRLGQRLGLDAASRVLDIASGRAGPAIILAREYGCHVTCVERFPDFAEAGHDRARAASVGHLVDVILADGARFPILPERFDATLCLGASFVFGGLDATLTALVVGTRLGGHVVVGEVYWRSPRPSGADSQGFVSLAETIARFDAHQLAVVSVIPSSDRDWDQYVTARFVAVERWLDRNGGHPDAPTIRDQHRAEQAKYDEERGLIGWTIIAGRKTDAAPAARPS